MVETSRPIRTPQRAAISVAMSLLNAPKKIEPVIRRFLTNTPQRFAVAKERVLLQGALIEINNTTGRAESIQRISEPLPAEPA